MKAGSGSVEGARGQLEAARIVIVNEIGIMIAKIESESNVSSSVKGKGKERETGRRKGKENLSDVSASKEIETQGVEGKEEDEAEVVQINPK
jgi:hypothetical protein